MKIAKNEACMSTEARLTVLENSVQNINSILLDFRQEMKRGFDKIDSRFESIERKLDAQDTKFENKFDKFEAKLETKFNAQDKRFDRLENRLWSNFFWLMGIMISLGGLIAHTQHWI